MSSSSRHFRRNLKAKKKREAVEPVEVRPSLGETARKRRTERDCSDDDDDDDEDGDGDDGDVDDDDDDNARDDAGSGADDCGGGDGGS